MSLLDGYKGRSNGVEGMTITLFIILLTIIGMWGITDGWFSLSLYLHDKDQTWGKDHCIRVIRIGFG